MKIIITKNQLKLINENYRRDRFDAEYSEEYPKYKKLFRKMLKQDVDSSHKGYQAIRLKNENGESLFTYMMGSKTLYYNYSLEDEMEDIIPSHIRSRHIKHAAYDYFKELFPDVEIKEVSGAHMG